MRRICRDLFRRFCAVCFGLLCCIVGQLPARAQQELPGDVEGGYHLKVYEDLVQLPTLVLNESGESFAGLQARDFRIALDSGPLFVPLHSRLEGDDPISMALLFDDAGVETSAVLTALSPQSHPLPDKFPGKSDQLAMYALDCNLVRARVLSGTASGADALVQELLHSPTLHTDEGSMACARPIHLLDALAVVGKQLREQAGRRVLVVVTDGQDAGSRNTWEAVRQYFGGAGITLFAIRPVSPHLMPAGEPGDLLKLARIEREGRLSLLAGGTGGLVVTTSHPDLANMLTRTVFLLRKRYILEFHRPRNGTAGMHQVDVLAPGRNAHIRASGVTVPLRETQAVPEPSVVPRNAGEDPVPGDRHILPVPQS